MYNDKYQKRDKGKEPIAQVYDPGVEDFVPLMGTHGAMRMVPVMERYGATVADRPPVSEVPVGTYYIAVDTDEIWQSNGTTWVVK